MTRFVGPRWGAMAVFALLVGCAGPRLQTRADVVDDIIGAARRNGAMRCAPYELAMAVSHNDFAKEELFEGRYHDARDQLSIAETNARLALQKSPPEKCADRDAPAVALVPTVSDADGDGIADEHDGCPQRPEDYDDFQDTDGCPEPDNDKDGIPDLRDNCPLQPEDIDGYEDDDGCPDIDNDGDGIADAVDQCPSEPEDRDGYEDDDGCPDCDNDGDGVPECPKAIDKCPTRAGNTPDGCPPPLVRVTKTRIELLQKIYFETNKSVIRSISFPLLDEVAEALMKHPTIEVSIDGHTDSRGTHRWNQRLSDARASSVRTYLIGRGVQTRRMFARGFGETKPVATNRTKNGQQRNRRVEFLITRR